MTAALRRALGERGGVRRTRQCAEVKKCAKPKTDGDASVLARAAVCLD